MRSAFHRLLVSLIVAGFALSASVRAETVSSTDKLGKKIDNIAFTDATGKSIHLHDLKDKQAIVIVFLSFECPVSNSYAQPLAEMAKSYGDKVAFIGVCVNDETPAEIARHVKEFQIPFPVFKDEKFAAAEALKAEITPEAFVLDRHFILRYRGRIDNGYVARLKKNAQVTKHDLRQALDEVLAGKPVSEPATRAVGCTIQRDLSVRKPTGAVTYHKDVLPILQSQCQTCHRPGEVGPFALMTYKQAVNWGSDIKEYTQSRKMPPWKPADGLPFRDERKLTEKEIATLAAWVEGGMPEGDPKDTPPRRAFIDGWQLGKPDLVLTVDGDFHIGPSGNDIFRCFVLPTNLPEDKYVTAVEVRPGNPRVVHHGLIFLDTAGQARKLEQAEKEKKIDGAKDFGAGYSASMGVGFLPRGAMGGWAPGQVPRHLPAGTGYSLPKGADVVLQLHYHRDGRPEKDRTAIGLYFATKPIEKRFQAAVLPGRFLFIPAGDANFKVKGSVTIEQDCEIHSVMPHMHMLGKSIQVTMTPPGGQPRTVVAIKEWDYNWQESYFFKEPFPIKSGTKFEVEAVYDNSDKNPNNPFNPPRLVKIGQQTTDEMCFVFFGATSSQPGRIKTNLVPRPLNSP